ncbi:MAG: TIGR01777 family protein [Chitinophagales bacterium]|nr:TIGR01777 family protein [Chitinophagales bacterium]
MKKVLISGGTGLIGNYLQVTLKNLGYEVNILTRNPKAPNAFYWNYQSNEIDMNCFEEVSCIIHLAGENIGDKRWTNQQKQLIIDSRVKSTQLLYNSIKNNNIAIEHFITASGLGYYGNTTTVVDETAPIGNDFLAEVCQHWENAALQFSNIGTKVTIARLGIVMSKNGGVLPKLLASTKFHINTIFGDGNQYVSWIHIKDAVQIFAWLLQNQLEGIYNLCAPNPVSYNTLYRAINQKLNIVAMSIPIPKILLQTTLGEMSTMLLTSNNCSATKITNSGYNFEFETIEKCLANLLN